MNKYGFKKTIFHHLILSYTLLSVVLIGAMGAYWYTQANRMMDQETAKDNLTRLNAAQTFIEQTVLKKYEDNLQNKALAIRFIQNNSSLNLLLYSGWEGNLSRVASFRSDLEFFRVENAGVTNVSVYFPKHDYVIDADGFYMHAASAAEAEFIGGIGEKPLKRWLSRTNADGNPVMTYMIQLPYKVPNAKTEGYLIIDVDVNYLKKIIAPVLSSSDDKLLVLDEPGDLLFHVGEGSDERIGELHASIVSGSADTADAAGAYTLNDAELPGMVSQLSARHSAHRWTYAMYRPAHSLELFTEHLKTGLYTASGIVIVFGLAMSFMFSKRLYFPIKTLMARIGSYQLITADSSREDEYKIIGNTFSHMKEKIVDLESQARKSDRINLLLGVSVKDTAEQTGFPDTPCCVAYLRMIKGDPAELGEKCEQSGRLFGEFIPLNAGEAVFIYYAEQEEELETSLLVRDLEELRRSAGPELIFQAALGLQVQSGEEIADSYQTARQAGRYHFLYGPERIVVYSELQLLASEPLLFNFEHYRNSLKAGDQRNADDFIGQFETALLQGRVQIETAELAVMQLITHLYQCVIELELQHVLPYANLFDELKKDTLQGTLESIRTLSVLITERMKLEGNQAHAEVIRTLKAYIAEHLHEDLSLQVLAKEVSLAPAYVSTLFSEGTKESFTEYVTRLRLERAAELLVDQPRQPVAAIAEQTGYRNVQYFHNKFKAKYGVTPVQYRKSRRENKDWVSLNNG